MRMWEYLYFLAHVYRLTRGHKTLKFGVALFFCVIDDERLYAFFKFNPQLATEYDI